jgi:PST family polysaccharide transporter
VAIERTELTAQTLHGFKWSGLGAVLQAALQLIVLSSLAHLLTPHAFGLFGIALIFSTFAERIGKLGVGPAIVQLEHLEQTHIRIGFSLSLALGLLMFSLLWLFAPFFADFFDETELLAVLRAVALLFVIDSAGTVSENLLQRDLRFKELLVVNSLAYLFGNGIVAITCAWLGYGVWSLVAGSLAGRLIKVFILLRLSPQTPTLSFSFNHTKQLLRLGFGFTIGKVLNYAALQGDNFIVGRFLGAELLGIYTRAYQLMTLPAYYFGQVLEKVLFPAMAKRQSKRERLVYVYLMGIELVSCLALPIAVFLYVAAPELIYVILGPQWVEVIPVLKILSFAVFFRIAYKNGDTLVSAMGAVYRHALRQAVYTVLIIGGAWFASRWGLTGVAYAVLFAVFVNYTLMCLLSHKLLGFSWASFFRAHLPGIWLGVSLALILTPAMSWVRSLNSGDLIVFLLATTLSSLCCLAAPLFAPRLFRPVAASWLSNNISLTRFGRVGTLATWYLAKVA